MPQIDDEEEELIDEEVEMDEEDEDESTAAGPVESTIEVTIYDNRKIKWVQKKKTKKWGVEKKVYWNSNPHASFPITPHTDAMYGFVCLSIH